MTGRIINPIVSAFSLTFLIVLLSQQLSAINPFMPPTAFIPDGEPHVYEYNGEQRLFVYGSRDERITGYCGYGHDAWSAPINDLTKWTNHGQIFHVNQVKDVGYGNVEEQHFGAPDCVYNPITKKYYLYTFMGASYKMDGQQGPAPDAANYVPGFEEFGPKGVMAESESPAGPFINPVICDWPPINAAGTFDPSVLVDQQADGSIRVYAYWGMKKGDRWAELDPIDMHTIIDPITRKPNRNAFAKTLDPNRIKNSTLFKASSIKKIDDEHYVFIYSSNELRSGLTYCYTSNSVFIEGTLRKPSGLNPLVGFVAPSSMFGFKYFNFGDNAITNKEQLSLKLNCKVLHPITIQVLLAPVSESNNEQQRIMIAEQKIGPDQVSPSHQKIVIPVTRLEKLKKS
ncbi:MAG: hypothetical protein K9G70_08595 [Prolixibacteraceae bacterium]|nr:hypothetical protein [Prolixibacteraceae bacterium]